MNKRLWIFMAVMMAMCLMLAACSSNEPVPSTADEDAASTSAADAAPLTPVVDETPQDEPPTLASIDTPQSSDVDLPVEVEVSVDPEAGIDVSVDIAPEGIFAGSAAALRALDSYRFTTSFLFTGEDDGEIESGSIELSGAIMDADHKHFVWRDLDDGEQFEIIQLEDEAWVLDDGEWESVPSLVAEAMSQAVLIFAPSMVWEGLFGGLEDESRYVGKESMNGVAVHHYTSSYHEWAGIWQGEVLDATGDVWIAEAGYPVRYDFSATGTDEDGSRGAISWTMNLTDVGASIVIEPPL